MVIVAIGGLGNVCWMVGGYRRILYRFCRLGMRGGGGGRYRSQSRGGRSHRRCRTTCWTVRDGSVDARLYRSPDVTRDHVVRETTDRITKRHEQRGDTKERRGSVTGKTTRMMMMREWFLDVLQQKPKSKVCMHTRSLQNFPGRAGPCADVSHTTEGQNCQIASKTSQSP